jgi:hypothetical protein
VLRLAVLVTGAVAMALALAPVAGADGADTTIAALEAKGYVVQINWINGFDTEQLSVCTVTAVNNPDSASPTPGAPVTVYVDVTCPNHQED